MLQMPSHAVVGVCWFYNVDTGTACYSHTRHMEVHFNDGERKRQINSHEKNILNS